MTPKEAKLALERNKMFFDGHCIKVRTKSGAEYEVFEDIIDVATDGFANDGYVYGERTNGRIHMNGRRRVDTRGQLKWFLLSNVSLVKEQS